MTELEVHQGEVHQGDMLDRVTDSWQFAVNDIAMLADKICHTEFVPAGLRGKDGAKVAAAILTGRELGLPPMTALSSIHIINGKPGISAEMMRGLVLQAGHEIRVTESSSTRVVMKGRREGEEEWLTVEWTEQDARRAGLVSNGNNFTKYPRQMLAARCTTELCRLIFADVIHGLRSIEELESLGDEDIVLIPDGAEEPAAPAVKRQRRQVKVQPVDAPAGGAQPDRPSPGLTRRGKTDEATKTGAEPDEGKPGAGEAPADATDSAPPLPEDAAPASSGDDSGPPPVSSGGSDTPTPPVSEPVPDEDGAVPAEIVEDSEPRMTTEQQTKMMAGFTGLDVKDRAERLQVTIDLIGRTVETAKELSKSEASSVIDSLEQCKTRDDLEAIIQATVAHREGGES